MSARSVDEARAALRAALMAGGDTARARADLDAAEAADAKRRQTAAAALADRDADAAGQLERIAAAIVSEAELRIGAKLGGLQVLPAPPEAQR